MRYRGWMATGLGLALVLGSSVPTPVRAATGEAGSWELGIYGGQGFLDDYEGLDPDDDGLAGVRAACFLTPVWSLELSAQQLSSESDPLAEDFDIRSGRVNALYNFREGQSFRPFLTGGLGFENTEVGSIDENDTSLNVGGGLRWYLGQYLGLRTDARYIYTDVGGPIDEAQKNLELTAGLLFAFGGGPAKDTDGDGVPDRKDKCPDTPSGATVDAKGCPGDADGDGVFDGLDKCASTPAGCAVDASGCPKDGDGDGVIDCQDKCSDTAKGCKVDASGCPADEDKDGVCDGVDKCPGTTKSCKVDASGCPADEDKDGVCDGVDKCPGTAAGRKVDARGCELAFDERGTLRLEGVNFALNSDRLTPESTAVLDAVARSLAEWSQVSVEVAGHTDSQGSDAHNQKLSQRRAEAVRTYLAGKGIAASRLTAVGYGESQPVEANTTEAGRARNRRVELRKKS